MSDPILGHKIYCTVKYLKIKHRDRKKKWYLIKYGQSEQNIFI